MAEADAAVVAGRSGNCALLLFTQDIIFHEASVKHRLCPYKNEIKPLPLAAPRTFPPPAQNTKICFHK